MRRARFVAAGGAALLTACTGYTGALPSLVRSQSGGREEVSMPAQPLPNPAILGECRRFDGAVVPAGWAWCDGSLLHIKDNPQLFRILGRSAGGDGHTTFGLPKTGAFPFEISIGGIAVSNPKQLAAIFAERARRTLTAKVPPATAPAKPPHAASP